jgi:hypothetical protein
MDRSLKRISWFRPAAFCSRDFILFGDNVPANKAASVFKFLIPKNVTTFITILYSADLSAPEYFLFPSVKIKFKGLQFADVSEIQEATIVQLNYVQKETFSAAFEKLYYSAKACIYASGVYFE